MCYTNKQSICGQNYFIFIINIWYGVTKMAKFIFCFFKKTVYRNIFLIEFKPSAQKFVKVRSLLDLVLFTKNRGHNFAAFSPFLKTIPPFLRSCELLSRRGELHYGHDAGHWSQRAHRIRSTESYDKEASEKTRRRNASFQPQQKQIFLQRYQCVNLWWNLITTRISPSFQICSSHNRRTSFQIVFNMFCIICWHYSGSLQSPAPPLHFLCLWVFRLELMPLKSKETQFQQQLDFLLGLWSASVIPECKEKWSKRTALWACFNLSTNKQKIRTNKYVRKT